MLGVVSSLIHHSKEEIKLFDIMRKECGLLIETFLHALLRVCEEVLQKELEAMHTALKNNQLK